MIRAALDANVLISGTIVALGSSSQIVDAARSRQFVLVTSRPIIEEAIRNLDRDRIRRRYGITPDQVVRLRVL